MEVFRNRAAVTAAPEAVEPKKRFLDDVMMRAEHLHLQQCVEEG